MNVFLFSIIGFLAAMVFAMWRQMDDLDGVIGQSTNELRKKIWDLQNEVDHLNKKLYALQSSNDEENEDE